MDVTETRTITFTLTAAEATEYWIEVYEMLALLAAGPDQGNTRTGLVRIREIRDAIEAHGLGVATAPYPPAGPSMTGQVVAATQGTVPPAPPPWAPQQ